MMIVLDAPMSRIARTNKTSGDARHEDTDGDERPHLAWAEIAELSGRAGHDRGDKKADRDRVERSQLRVPYRRQPVPQRRPERPEHKACGEREEDSVQGPRVCPIRALSGGSQGELGSGAGATVAWRPCMRQIRCERLSASKRFHQGAQPGGPRRRETTRKGPLAGPFP